MRLIYGPTHSRLSFIISIPLQDTFSETPLTFLYAPPPASFTARDSCIEEVNQLWNGSSHETKSLDLSKFA